MAPRAELLLVNLGTPAAPTPEAVRAFLAEFLGDPMVVEKPRWLWLPILHGIVLRRRPKPVAEAYREIWTEAGSPLAAATERLVDALAAAAPDLRVRSAYRYGHPNLADRLAESARECPGGMHPIHVVPLFPHRTASSSGTIERLVRRLANGPEHSGRLSVAPLAPDAPGLVAALADGVRAALSGLEGGEPVHLLASFHGIPQAVCDREGGRYTADCRATFEALLAALGWPAADATLAYQSRFGRDPWIGPATDETLVALARAGTRRVVVATPGFLTPGLETIEELGLRARADFLAAGGEAFALAPCPAEGAPHPALVEALLAAAGPEA